MGKARVKVPETIKAGDIIEVRTIIQHPMETGNRKDANGQIVPRDIIHSYTAKFAGQVFFEGTFGPGISSNPAIVVQLKVPGPGELELTWVDDQGETTVEKVTLNVVPA